MGFVAVNSSPVIHSPRFLTSKLSNRAYIDFSQNDALFRSCFHNQWSPTGHTPSTRHT